jgi:F-type H+-transporting ATPase subunit epsilon
MAETHKQAMNFELVSPEAKLVSEPVSMAVIPGEMGEMGVGYGHASFIVSLKPGVVKLYTNDNATDDKGARKIFITGGFADITNESCTVLAEEAVNVADIEVAPVEQQIRDLTEDLSMAQNYAEKSRLTRKLALAKARLQAATGQLVI